MLKTIYQDLCNQENGEDRVKYPIDGFNERYFMNQAGVVFEKITIGKNTQYKNVLPREKGNYLYFYLTLGDSYIVYVWEKLFLMAFSPMYVSPESYRYVLTLRKYDKTQTLPNMLNLNWIVPEGGVETLKFPGYYGIPNNPHLVISKKLEFIQTATGKKAEIYYPNAALNKSYPAVAINEEVKKLSPRVTGLVHRLVAFAFIPILAHRSQLYVNHIDGIKVNFHPKNLEWVNHKENADHAIASGLRPDNKEVTAYNVTTQQVKHFVSYGECGKFFNVLPALIAAAIYHYKKDKSIKIKPWVILHREDPVPNLKKVNLDVVAYSQNRQYKVVDTKSGEVSYFFRNKDMLDKVGSTRALFENHFPKRLTDYSVGHYVVTDVQMSEVPEEALALKPKHIHGTKPQKPIRVTTLSSGEVKIYDSSDAFASAVGAKRKTIQRGANYNNGVWNGYRIEFLDYKAKIS